MLFYVIFLKLQFY